MPKRKAQRGQGFARKAKPKEGSDRRYTGALPGRPPKVADLVEEQESLRWGKFRQMLPVLLWGGPDVYAREQQAETWRYEQTGQFQRAMNLQDGAEQSSYRARGLGGEHQRGRDQERALEHCSAAEHAANYRHISFSMAVRSISMLGRRSQSKRAWRENPTLLGKRAAYDLVQAMMEVQPAHTFKGDKDMLNAVIVYDQVFRSDGCKTKSGESRGRQRLNAEGRKINAGPLSRQRRGASTSLPNPILHSAICLTPAHMVHA